MLLRSDPPRVGPQVASSRASRGATAHRGSAREPVPASLLAVVEVRGRGVRAATQLDRLPPQEGKGGDLTFGPGEPAGVTRLPAESVAAPVRRAAGRGTKAEGMHSVRARPQGALRAAGACPPGAS